MKILDLIEEYKEYLRHERKLTTSTVTAYISDLKKLGNAIDKKIEKINLNDLRIYIRNLSHSGLKASSIRRKIRGFNTFWKWLRMQGYTSKVVSQDLHLPKQQRKVPNWMSEEEMKIFANTTPSGKNYRYIQRNEAAWKTLTWLGIRRSELLNLRIKDIRFNQNIIIIRDTKTKEDRQIVLPERLKTHLEQLCEGRDRNEFAFGIDEKKWTINAFMIAFKRHLRDCGLEDRDITPHTLRHSVATNLVRRGVHITTVKEILGHKDIKTTMIYTHVGNDIILNAMEKHPLND